MRRLGQRIFLAALLACPSMTIAATATPMAHLFGYRMLPGQTVNFQKGYREHLKWHVAHHDQLPWYAWTVVDGPRAGMFIDGTFDVARDALDHRPDPAGDGADAARTFLPFGTPAMRESWRRVLPDTSAPLAHPERPLRVIVYTLKPGTGARFDALLTEMAKTTPPSQPYAWFAPVSGSALNRRVLLVALDDGAAAPDLESRIDAQADMAKRVAWRDTFSATVTAVEAETWQPKPELMLLPHR